MTGRYFRTLLFTLLLTVLVTLVTTTTIEVLTSRNLLLKMAARDSERFTRITAAQLSEYIRSSETTIKTLSDYVNSISERSSINIFFDVVLANTPQFDQFLLIDKNATILEISGTTRSLIGQDMSYHPAFIQSQEQERMSRISNVFQSEFSGKPTVALSWRTDCFTVIGYLSFHSLAEMITGIYSNSDTFVTITDPTGVFIVHPDETLVSTRSSSGYIISLIEDGTEKVTLDQMTYNDRAFMTSTSKASPWNLYVQIWQPRSFLQGYVSYLIVTSIVLAVILSIGALLFALIRTRSTYRPLLVLIRASRQITAGNYAQIDQNEPVFDEFRELHSTFNSMAASIKERTESLENELSHRKQAELAMQFILKNVAGKRGDDYLDVLIENLAGFLNMEIVLISLLEVSVDEDILEGDLIVRAGYHNGSFSRGGRYKVLGTPCGEVLKAGEVVTFEDSVHILFPDLEAVLGEHLVSYIGIPLKKEDTGEIIGVVCALGKSIHRVTSIEREIMEICSSLAVTELTRLAMEQDIEVARDNALAAMKAKDLFLANMSHEMRTPLNGIRGMVSLLKDTNPDQEQNTYLSLLDQASGSLELVINDILDFSIIESQKIKLMPEWFNLTGMSRDLIKLYTPNAEKSGLVLKLQHTNKDIFIFTDKNRLRQVITNLLTNAIKYTDSGTVVLIISINSENKVEIGIQDTGIGIHDRDMDRIFTSFEQLESTYTKTRQGIGLGLAITRKLVALMKGAIDVKSTPGKGSLFTVKLPVRHSYTPPVKEAEDATPRQEPTHSSQPEESRTVLIAEDEAINRMYIASLLKRWGYSPIEAVDGQETLEKLEQPGLYAAIIDIGMPVYNGLQVARKYRANETRMPKLPLIALTAHAYASDIKSCKDAGLDFYLSKPFSEASLRVTLENAKNG